MKQLCKGSAVHIYQSSQFHVFIHNPHNSLSVCSIPMDIWVWGRFCNIANIIYVCSVTDQLLHPQPTNTYISSHWGPLEGYLHIINRHFSNILHAFQTYMVLVYPARGSCLSAHYEASEQSERMRNKIQTHSKEQARVSNQIYYGYLNNKIIK